jgi:hypothetical protein
MAATIVDNLPEENDPMRAEAESLGCDATVMAYLGEDFTPLNNLEI